MGNEYLVRMIGSHVNEDSSLDDFRESTGRVEWTIEFDDRKHNSNCTTYLVILAG